MTKNDVVEWLKELVETPVPSDSRAIFTTRNSSVRTPIYSRAAATAWLVDAHTAVAAIFPVHHPVMRRIEAASARVEAQPHAAEDIALVDSVREVLRSAIDQIEKGRLGSVLDGVRAETVLDVVEQADALNQAGHQLAATVLCGGALETHLHHLCEVNGIPWPGDGSIGAYNDAIAKARNDGTCAIYDAADTKQVTAWGGMRNDAAHKPTKFDRKKPAVQSMIDGVRAFIARTSSS